MIRFASADRPVSLKQRTAVKAILGEMFHVEKTSLSGLLYVFCSDEYLLQINKDFLQHDFYTDIITFEMGDPKVSGVDGEIYISTDRVKDNAGTMDISFQEELLRVVFHGALHLCGYKDKSPAQERKMREMEEKYLSIWKKRYAN
jgi:probable rRNA maturation factor